MAINRGWVNRGLLAVHAVENIIVYSFEPEGPLVELGRFPTDQPMDPYGRSGPGLSVAWSTTGAELIFGTNIFTYDEFGGVADEYTPEFTVLAVSQGGSELIRLHDVAVCPAKGEDPLYIVNGPNDILTANGLVTPTPPTATATPTPTPTATLTPSPTTATTPTPTRRPPVPVYLPLLLREECIPGKQRIDVALVIDASTSMRDDMTSAQRSKLSAAIEAATSFVATMDLPRDQTAVVAFNSDAQVIQTLTGRPADIEAALARIQRLVRQQTRIDRGIEDAHEELASARHKPANRPVMIVLTDGLANPEPASTAVRRAQTAKDDHITIFTIGLGRDTDLNIAELREMASRPEYFYRPPDGEDLLGIYQTIAAEIPCPVERYWGKR